MVVVLCLAVTVQILEMPIAPIKVRGFLVGRLLLAIEWKAVCCPADDRRVTRLALVVHALRITVVVDIEATASMFVAAI